MLVFFIVDVEQLTPIKLYVVFDHHAIFIFHLIKMLLHSLSIVFLSKYALSRFLLLLKPPVFKFSFLLLLLCFFKTLVD